MMHMTYEDFLIFRNVTVRDKNHERIIRMFYPYLQRVCGIPEALPKVISEILGVALHNMTVETGCFNSIPDDRIPPYGDSDFYIKFDTGIQVYIYALFALADTLSASIESIGHKHFIMK